jgi:all-trans-retinol dehydrogenase (NAD+)
MESARASLVGAVARAAFAGDTDRASLAVGLAAGVLVLILAAMQFCVGSGVRTPLSLLLSPLLRPSSSPLTFPQLSCVLITGAGSGIGRQMALEFARRGCPLALLDIDEASVRSVHEEILALAPTPSSSSSSSPPSSVYAVCDVSSASSVRAALASVRERMRSPIRVVVSNAGIVLGRDVDALSDADVRASLAVNVGGAFTLLRELLPELKAARSGCVVVTGSVMGLIGSARLSEYVAGKWALLGLVESLRLELQRDGLYDAVATVALLPSHVSTGLFEGAFEDDANPVRALCFPPLRDTAVARAAVDAVAAGGHHVLVLPRSLGWITLLARLALPLRAFDTFVGWFGGWRGMNSFRGRGDGHAAMKGARLGSGEGGMAAAGRKAWAEIGPAGDDDGGLGTGLLEQKKRGPGMTRLQSLTVEEEEREGEGGSRRRRGSVAQQH